MSTATTYRARHDWGAVRLSTTQAQLRARLTVVDAVGEPAAGHLGRHRTLPIVCECVHDCRDCSLSGEWHVHPGEPCALHPDAEGDR